MMKVRNHPLYKSILSQVEVCRGTNVQQAIQITKLEESLQILQTQNLYLQEENQRVKGINEGLSSSNQNNPSSQQFQTCQNKDDPRVLILENESISTKLKLLEQNFQSQMLIM